MWDLWLQLLESLETVCSGDKSLAGTLDHIYGSFLETIALFHCFKSPRLLSPGVVESQKKYITCSSLPHVGVPLATDLSDLAFLLRKQAAWS